MVPCLVRLCVGSGLDWVARIRSADSTNIKLKLHTCHSNIGTCVRRYFIGYLDIFGHTRVCTEVSRNKYYPLVNSGLCHVQSVATPWCIIAVNSHE